MLLALTNLKMLKKSVPAIMTTIARQFIILSIIVVFSSQLIISSITVFPIFFLWRSAVVLYAKYFRPQLHKLVQGSVVAMACDSIYEKPEMNLVGFMILDGKMDFEKLRDEDWLRVVNKKISDSSSSRNNKNAKEKLLYPQLQQTLSQFGGYLFWKWDNNFDIKNHVRYYDYEGELLALPNEGYCTEKDLERVYGGLLSAPWKEGRSLWEFLYIGKFKSIYANEEDSNSKEQCIAAYRIHHSLADGYSIIKLLQELSNVDIKDRVEHINYLKFTTWEWILHWALLLVRGPYDMASNIFESIDGSNCWHLLSSKLSRDYNVSISKPFRVDFIKEIKNQLGASYNAVLCAAAAGGFCKLMKDAGQIVPQEISSFYIFPLPNHPEGLVFHASGVGIKFPMASAKCSVDRLKKINSGIRKSKYYMGHYLVPLLGSICSLNPIFVTRQIRNFMFHTVLISSLPGPSKPMDFGGAKMTDAMTCCGATGGEIALVMILVSICGKQRFVAQIDKTIFPSQEMFSKLSEYIEEELDQMLQDCNSNLIQKVKHE